MATLYQKLVDAGFAVQNADENGTVSLQSLDLLTPEQSILYSDIILEHVSPTAYALMLRIRNRLAASKITADNIPNWATWTQAEWNTYFNANLSDSEADLVTTLAAARVMIKRQNLVIQNLVKMVIAMRDAIWPDLPEA